MTKHNEPPKQSFVKVVYFDEDSASDFLDMKLGGQMQQEETDVAERHNEVATRAATEAGAKFKWLNFFSFGVMPPPMESWEEANVACSAKPFQTQS